MSMEISERDKQLLYIVIAIAILAGAFFFGFKNFSDKKAEYEAKTEQYNTEYAELIEYQKKRAEYVELTKQYGEKREEILASFEDGYNQENFIKTISDIESKDGVWVNGMEFVLPESVYEFVSVPGTYGVANTTSMEYIATYDEFKDMLASLLAINSKTTIVNMSAKYQEDTQLIEGEVTLTHYCIENLESKGPEVKIDLETGVDNIFDSSFVTSNSHTDGSEGSYILTDHDLAVIISQDEASNDSIIVGTTNDADAKDSISSDANETTELTITVDGKDGKYTISYQLGDEKYPSKNFEKGATFKPGDTLDLLVLSSIRADKKDKVAVKANLINNSDMKLNVLVSGDDESSPRFSAVKREGDIVIYR